MERGEIDPGEVTTPGEHPNMLWALAELRQARNRKGLGVTGTILPWEWRAKGKDADPGEHGGEGHRQQAELDLPRPDLA